MPADRRRRPDRVAFLGHNLVQAFERYAFPFLAIVFVIAAIIILSKAAPRRAAGGAGGLGGFLLTFGAAFGYAAGWNPYATDYTRYLAPTAPGRAAGLCAGLGVFVSCVALEVVGAASATIAGARADRPDTAASPGTCRP